MQVFKMEVYVYDHECLGVNNAILELQRSKYIGVHVADWDMREINDWNDDHPLNKTDGWLNTVRKLFERSPK